MYRWVHVSCGHTHLVKCFSPPELAIKEGDACIVGMERFFDYGEAVQIIEVAEEADDSVKSSPSIVRRATLHDQARANENVLFSKNALRLCREKIEQYQLVMRLLKVRYSFDRALLMVFFMAEARVDFRKLVADLAGELGTRVEMRQVDPRTAAAILGGVAPCGRELCCASWNEGFNDIHLRMAKIQGVSLTPAVTGGMCGCLKCCLRFEYNCYRDLVRGLPRAGERVDSPGGPGQVQETRALTRRIKVRLDDDRALEFNADEVIVLGKATEKKDNAIPCKKSCS